MATPQKTSEAALPPLPPRPYEDRRLQMASISQGEPMILTLPDTEELDEGDQDCNRFAVLGPRLVMGQWIQVTNDAGSFWALMRIEQILGGVGSVVRGLRLRYIAPPYKVKREVEAPVATGEWHIHWGGAFKKWQVISPNGQVRAEQINSESEARNRMRDFQNNAKAFAR